MRRGSRGPRFRDRRLTIAEALEAYTKGPAGLLKAKVLYTMVGGKVVYEAGEPSGRR